MSRWTRWFGGAAPDGSALRTDLHSHLLPGIDDGAPDLDASLAMIRRLHALGYSQLITTPHIMAGQYDNDRQTIMLRRDQVREALRAEGIPVRLEAAAEYYLDEHFLARLDRNEPLLTFGGNHVLIETSFMVAPVWLEEVIFRLRTAGYQPVLAHPERYLYLAGDYATAERLVDAGVLLQINLLSLRNYYSPAAGRFARGLIDRGWVHMVGSDCHRMRHLDALARVFRSSRYFRKVVALPLRNPLL